MLEETALVVAANADQLWLETQARSSCGHCSNNACGTSVLAKLFSAKRNRIQLDNSLGVEIGEKVIIGMPDELLVRAAIWAYLLPLVIMVLATIAASMAGAGDGLQSILALTSLAAAFIGVQRYTRSGSSYQRFKPRLLRKANQTEISVKPIKLSKNI